MFPFLLLGCTGGAKKESENIVVSVKVENKLVLGTLSVEKHPQIACDLIFESDFELSHSSKTTSVFLCGYKLQIPVFEYPLSYDLWFSV